MEGLLSQLNSKYHWMLADGKIQGVLSVSTIFSLIFSNQLKAGGGL